MLCGLIYTEGAEMEDVYGDRFYHEMPALPSTNLVPVSNAPDQR